MGPEHPAVDPQSFVHSASDAAKRLETRSYTTFLARVRTYRRLKFRGAAWDACLISAATATTIGSVGMLSDPLIFGSRGDALLTISAILSLVASLVVANLNYRGRSQTVEGNYKRIQQISLEAEALVTRSGEPSDVAALRREYEIALESSENHSEADYRRAELLRTKNGPKGSSRVRDWIILYDSLVSYAPLVALIVPVGFAIPIVLWFVNA